MKLLDWLKNTLFPNDDVDEEYDEDQEYDEEQEEAEEEEAPRASRPRPFRVLGLGRGRDEEEEEEDEIFEEDPSARPAQRPQQQAPVSRPAYASPRIYRFHAASLEDARRVCDALRGRNMVLVDLEGTPFSMAQSVMDFCCGACCALGCGIRNVNKNVFVMGPNDADFDVAFGDEFTTYRGKFKSYD